MLQKICHVGKKLYFCTRFRKGNHLKSRIRLVVQDNCLSRSRSPVRLWYAVRKNDNMQCICRFFLYLCPVICFFCYLCNLNFKLIVMHKCLLFLVFALMTCFAANTNMLLTRQRFTSKPRCMDVDYHQAIKNKMPLRDYSLYPVRITTFSKAWAQGFEGGPF